MTYQAGAERHKSTVLIVDGDQPTLSYYRKVLGHDYDIVVAASGKCALEVPLGDIGVAVLELKLPDMDGMAVLKSIRNARPALPTLIVTRYGCEEAAVKAFRAGARNYLKQPASYQELRGAIESCLSAAAGGMGCSVQDALGLKDQTSSPGGDRPRSGGVELQAVVKYIEDNYMETISLSAVARQACLSKFHLCRTLKRYLGVSFKEYLNGFRIEKAKEMLERGRSSVTEVALTVGFGDVSHFGRVFKRLNGCTPTQYVASWRMAGRRLG